MNQQKIEEVVNSYINGQKKQMVEQIKAYGQRKFFIDFFECQEDWERWHKGIYGRIVYTFFYMKEVILK